MAGVKTITAANGCWECADFPCQGGMLNKLRIRAFARFAREYGTDELKRCLMRNKANGIAYHLYAHAS